MFDEIIIYRVKYLGLFDLFKKKEEDLLELPVEEEEKTVFVRVENLREFMDVERIKDLVKQGNIVFLKTKDMQRRDLGEFQTCVQKLKRIATQHGFDIAGTEEGYIVLTPTFAQILRG